MSKKNLADLGVLLRATIPDRKPTDATISYSQFSMYQQCQHHWKLQYIDKIRIGGPNMSLVFGTAFHETLQVYLYTLYHKSAKEADQMNLPELLQQRMAETYEIEVHANNNGEHFSTPQEMGEFYEDGIEILTFIRKHRADYFKVMGWELLGVEMPIYIQAIESNPNVIMNGFIDLVLRDTVNDEIWIFDIKTSRMGWNKYQKADKGKTAQLVLYKEYFAKQYGYNIDKINVKYFIVKRKTLAESMYPQKRVQEFEPSSGRITRKQLAVQFEKFITECFNPDGTKNTNKKYVAFTNNAKNCKWCPFATKYDLCPKENRINK